MEHPKINLKIVVLLIALKALMRAKLKAINEAVADFVAFCFVSAGLPVPQSTIDIMKTIDPLLGMLIGIVLLTVILPIAVSFIIATNMTGWNSNLKTFWTTAVPAIIILMGFALIIENILTRGSKSGGRRR